MAQTQLRPAPLAKVAGLGISLSSPERSSQLNASSVFRQGPINTVGIVAARSGVAAATVRAQFDAWRIGGGQ